MALNDHQEQMVYDTLLDLMKEIGVLAKESAPSMVALIYATQEYTAHLQAEGDYRDRLIKDCFNALERRHADDLVDELKERYGMEG